MKIVVLGAAGNIGRHTLLAAVAAGHEVVAFARRPESVPPLLGVRVVVGSVEDEAAMVEAFAGADAVISAVGPAFRMGSRKPIDFMQRVLPRMTAAVKQAGVPRFVLVSAFGAGDTLAQASGLARLVYRLGTAPLFEDKALAERALPASGITYTIAYPVNLKEAPPLTAAAVKPLGKVGSVPGLPTLPFANVGQALVELAEDRAAESKRVLITTPTGWKPLG
ncbi:NAD(P)-dependent oxidoreductase [Microterricola viridarii]|uniref:NAD(P)H-binding n=1 Tax=Microterricola viridarii TaxID=412690 RepID=A0A1H1YDT8_9MICO|nr:NAD(P)-binding oxidoreductase [Microterricola viridarii]SDT19582.1 NAD(P)H-binding [Microterricola viridarii]